MLSHKIAPYFQVILFLLLACWFLLLAMIDFRYCLLVDFLTQPLMWLGVILAYFNCAFISLEMALIGIFFGYLLLKIPALIFYLVTKKIGLGGGDIKLLAALGAWIPYSRLPLLLIIASLLGMIYYLVLRYLLHYSSLKMIPFGPFLLIAGYGLIYFL
ncbi:A24 family peptidase [Orbaceae bacterium ESL0727]|nr:A24 family peptidase [Orbaceae bacterium ESL0727]